MCRQCDQGNCRSGGNTFSAIDVCGQPRVVCDNHTTGVTFHDLRHDVTSAATCYCLVGRQRGTSSELTYLPVHHARPTFRMCETLNRQCTDVDPTEEVIRLIDSNDFLLMLFDSLATAEKDIMLGQLSIVGDDIEIQCAHHVVPENGVYPETVSPSTSLTTPDPDNQGVVLFFKAFNLHVAIHKTLNTTHKLKCQSTGSL